MTEPAASTSLVPADSTRTEPGEPTPRPTPRRSGPEMPAARAALVAVIAGGAVAVGAARTVELLVVVAVIQVAFVLAWALGAAVAVEPGESFDGPEDVVELGPVPALFGGAPEDRSYPQAEPDPDADLDPDADADADQDADAAPLASTGADGTSDPSSDPGSRVRSSFISSSLIAARAGDSANPLEVFAPVREDDPSPGSATAPGPVPPTDAQDSTQARSQAGADADAAEEPTDFASPAAGAMPGRIGAIVIGLGAAAAADVAVSRWPHSELSPMLGILGLAVPVMFAHQLIRGVVRARVVESLSGIAMIIVAVIALPAFVQLRHEVGGGHLVAAAASASAVSIVVGLLVDLVWSRPRFDPAVPRGLTAVVLATVAGAVVGAYPLRHQAQFSATQAVLYCAVIAGVSALVAVATSLIGYSSPSTGTIAQGARALRPVALALLPIMLAAPAAYEVLVSV